MNTILLLLIGVCIGIILHYIYLSFACRIAGTLNIDTSDESKDLYTFEINMPLGSLTRFKMIRVKITGNSDLENHK